MSKVKFKWVDMGWFSLHMEVPQSKMAHERQENKRINHQIKQINRHQKNIRLKQNLRTR